MHCQHHTVPYTRLLDLAHELCLFLVDRVYELGKVRGNLQLLRRLRARQLHIL